MHNIVHQKYVITYIIHLSNHAVGKLNAISEHHRQQQNINWNLPSVETLRHKPASTDQREIYNIKFYITSKTRDFKNTTKAFLKAVLYST